MTRALFLDFNGTLSDDEGVLADVYAAMMSEQGRPLDRSEYLERLAGHTDEEIFRRCLGDGADVEALTAERIARYAAAVADGSTITPAARAAVAAAAARVRVMVVTSAFRVEVEPVLRAAGLALEIVCADDVPQAKPDPALYLLACERAGVEPAEAWAVEDSTAGVAAARAAGVRVAALTTTMPAARLAAADLHLAAFDVPAVELLLGQL